MYLFSGSAPETQRRRWAFACDSTGTWIGANGAASGCGRSAASRVRGSNRGGRPLFLGLGALQGVWREVDALIFVSHTLSGERQTHRCRARQNGPHRGPAPCAVLKVLKAVPVTVTNFFLLQPSPALTGCPVLLPPAPRCTSLHLGRNWMRTPPPDFASRPLANGPASRSPEPLQSHPRHLHLPCRSVPNVPHNPRRHRRPTMSTPSE